MLEAALQAEVDEYIQRHRQERDENGHALVVRNGLAQERTVQCGAGQLKIQSAACPRQTRRAEIHQQYPAALHAQNAAPGRSRARSLFARPVHWRFPGSLERACWVKKHIAGFSADNGHPSAGCLAR